MAQPEGHRDRLFDLALLLVLVLVIPIVLVAAFWATPVMGYTGMAGISTTNAAILAFGVILILVVIVLFARALEHQPRPAPLVWPAPPMVPATGREILDARYARGEITRDDYFRMREDLEPRRP